MKIGRADIADICDACIRSCHCFCGVYLLPTTMMKMLLKKLYN